MAQKHQVLQNVIVMDVYTGGSPSIVEECGFGSGEKGYAQMQCVMAEFENDPLIAQYAGAAMMRIWEAGKILGSSLLEVFRGQMALDCDCNQALTLLLFLFQKLESTWPKCNSKQQVPFGVQEYHRRHACERVGILQSIPDKRINAPVRFFPKSHL